MVDVRFADETAIGVMRPPPLDFEGQSQWRAVSTQDLGIGDRVSSRSNPEQRCHCGFPSVETQAEFTIFHNAEDVGSRYINDRNADSSPPILQLDGGAYAAKTSAAVIVFVSSAKV